MRPENIGCISAGSLWTLRSSSAKYHWRACGGQGVACASCCSHVRARRPQSLRLAAWPAGVCWANGRTAGHTIVFWRENGKSFFELDHEFSTGSLSVLCVTNSESYQLITAAKIGDVEKHHKGLKPGLSGPF